MEVHLRETTESDMELVMAWRSNPLVFDGTYTQDRPLTWKEHYTWWHNRGPWFKIFIIQVSDETGIRDVGVVTIGQLDYWEPETGLYIGEVTIWGHGVGKHAVSLAIEYLRQQGYRYTRTTILDSNTRSIQLYLSLGFARIADARPGESLYRKSLI